MSDIGQLNTNSNNQQIQEQRKATEQNPDKSVGPDPDKAADDNLNTTESSQREMSAGIKSFYRPMLGQSKEAAESLTEQMRGGVGKARSDSGFTGANKPSGPLTPGEYKDGLTADLNTAEPEHVAFAKGKDGKPDKVKHCGENGCYSNEDWGDAAESHKNALQNAHNLSQGKQVEQKASQPESFVKGVFGEDYQSNPAFKQASKDASRLSGDASSKLAFREILKDGSLSPQTTQKLSEAYRGATKEIAQLKTSISTATGDDKAQLQEQLSSLEQAQESRFNLSKLDKGYAKAPDGDTVRNMGDSKVLKLSTGETGSYRSGEFIADKPEAVVQEETEPKVELKDAVETKAPEKVEEKKAEAVDYMEKALEDFDVPDDFKDAFRERGGVFAISLKGECKYCDAQHKAVFGSKDNPGTIQYIDGITPYIVKKFENADGKALQAAYGNDGKGIFPYSVKIDPQGKVKGATPGYADMPLLIGLSKK